MEGSMLLRYAHQIKDARQAVSRMQQHEALAQVQTQFDIIWPLQSPSVQLKQLLCVSTSETQSLTADHGSVCCSHRARSSMLGITATASLSGSGAKAVAATHML